MSVHKTYEGYMHDLYDRYHRRGLVGSSYWGRLGDEALSTSIINFDNDGIDEYNKVVGLLVGDSYTYAL